MSTRRPTRREVLVAGGAAAGAALLGASPASAAPRRVLRIAHLTDWHIQPELGAYEGTARALEHASRRRPRPDLILAGGDLIMDSFAQTRDRTRVQWELYRKVVRNHTDLPIEACIGNHDVWGWHRQRAGTTGSEPQFGKQWAMDELGLTSRYRSFDRAGWHFVVLDSTYPRGDGYTARLDDEQFEWLKADLERVPRGTPVLVLSHIPILAVCSFFDGQNEKSGDWVIPGAWMHIDARRLKDLFYRVGNVRLCLSGHEHLVDRVDLLGTTYLCNGAVCGNWWKGNYHETPPGYGIVDLYSDGTFRNEYTSYGPEIKR